MDATCSASALITSMFSCSIAISYIHASSEVMTVESFNLEEAVSAQWLMSMANGE